jgi:exonuclease VII large subunit
MTLPDRLHTATLLRLDRENERVFKFSSNLIHFAQQRIHLGTLQIRELSAKVEKESLRAINALEMKPLEFLSKLEKLSLEKLFKTGETISALELKLGSIDPSPWLNLGWTRLELEKRPVLSLAQLSHGDLVDARVKGGILKLRVEDIIQKTTLFSTGQNHE